MKDVLLEVTVPDLFNVYLPRQWKEFTHHALIEVREKSEVSFVPDE